jgi:hypothetical protein
MMIPAQTRTECVHGVGMFIVDEKQVHQVASHTVDGCNEDSEWKLQERSECTQIDLSVILHKPRTREGLVKINLHEWTAGTVEGA